MFKAARVVAIAALLLTPAVSALKQDVLHPTGAAPSYLAKQFREAAGFQQAASGQYSIFDRGSHAVFGMDEQQTGTWVIAQIGGEQGRILDATAFSVEPGGTFAVADAPFGQERVQVFTPAGFPIGGFTLPIRKKARIVMGSCVLNGIGSLQYTGETILISQPESGALITEYSLHGVVYRTFGYLRQTGQEDDRDVHVALNSGVPLVNPHGGFYFVFQAGAPAFRKYDASGALLFERQIQGPEIDDFVKNLTKKWPRRATSEGEVPFVTPTVRAAAVDPDGNLWVTMAVPVTYVFDADGDKIRTVQFRTAGVIAPTTLFFSPRITSEADRGSGRVLVTPGLYEFDTR